MKTAVIIQARMGSSRLPGKVLLPLGRRLALDHVIERARAARNVDQVVVATSTLGTDDPIAEYCLTRGIACSRGSESDVLARYLHAMRQFPSEIVVRLTADCPLTDPFIIDELVATLKDSAPALDYHSNTLPPRRIPHGLDVEVFRREALERAGREAVRPEEREHVTPYIYRHPELFRITQAHMPQDLSGHRWTLDTEADRRLLDNILTELKPGNYRWQDSLAVLDRHPDWMGINATISQKKLES
jgi:spore coat polysaccharide biosynthesis protein SpsF